MIRPVHIFLLSLLASLGVLFYPKSHVVLNELVSASVIMAIYFLQRKKMFNRVDVVASYGLLALNVCNLLGNLSLISYVSYILIYLFVSLVFLITLFYFEDGTTN